MQRRFVALVAVVAVLAMPALATAAVTVTASDHVFPIGGGVAVVNVLITSDAGEGLNSMDLDVIVNNNASGGPVITGFNITGAPTLWAANANTLFPGLDPPGTEIFASVANNAAVDSPIGASSILATITFDTTGLAPGSYPWTVGALDGAAPTVLQSVGGEIFPEYIAGNLIVPEVPEPSTIVLGLFAAAGMAAVVIRRRRAA